VPERGGTLRVLRPEGVVFRKYSEPATLDPLAFPPAATSIHRCCLSRGLLGYDGRRARDGGVIVHPDAAESLPTISLDGLEWTFRLKEGLRYGPPFEDVPVTAADFVRGFHRAVAPGIDGYAQALDAIAGVGEYAAGQAATIVGLEAPDERTLIIRLTEPSGALEAMLAAPLIMPIPANPCDPDAPFGIYQGHDDGIGTFAVSTGPYMLEGAERLDFCRPADEQEPVPSVDAGDTLVLVRNPSWDAASDDLRGAYADRIEIVKSGSVDDSLADVLEGRADLFWDPVAFRYSISPERQAQFGAERTFVDEDGTVYSNAMNVAVPPFDDIHVRRAVNHAIDKIRVVEALGGPYAATPIGHIAPDGLLDNLLLGWDPYAGADGLADLDAARAEMALSRYDTNGDGVCDADACRNVRALTRDLSASSPDGIDPWVAVSDTMKGDLARIGIDLAVERKPVDEMLMLAGDPREGIPIVLGVGWFSDLNASGYFEGFASGSVTDEYGNITMVGATPAQLAGWGYPVTETPNVDARVDACLPLTGSAQFECWASLDQYLMLEVVPWVPLAARRNVSFAGPRVTSYSWDELSHTPAWDRIGVSAASD
jgi:peptide/nickel transport system substrate-binding protein